MKASETKIEWARCSDRVHIEYEGNYMLRNLVDWTNWNPHYLAWWGVFFGGAMMLGIVGTLFGVTWLWRSAPLIAGMTLAVFPRPVEVEVTPTQITRRRPNVGSEVSIQHDRTFEITGGSSLFKRTRIASGGDSISISNFPASKLENLRSMLDKFSRRLTDTNSSELPDNRQN